MEQIGSMLSSFTQRKTEEVSRTVATIHSQLDSSRHAVGSSFAELATLSASTAGHCQVRLPSPPMHCYHKKSEAFLSDIFYCWLHQDVRWARTELWASVS